VCAFYRGRFVTSRACRRRASAKRRPLPSRQDQVIANEMSAASQQFDNDRNQVTI